MSSSERAEQSAQQPCPGARPYLRVPVDLIVRYRSRPAVIGIYASIVRLNAIYKCAVDVSRTDFACWCGVEPDMLAGCTKRAIGDLEAGGWIIKATGAGGKLRLLAAWGKGVDGKARPFRPDSRDRGKPSRARFIALPLDLFDLYLGRLTPDAHDQARVDRYFDRALLSFADIGTYALRQFATVPPTPRLTRLGLAPDIAPADTLDMADLPILADLLAQAAAGTLFTCDNAGASITVALSRAGAAKLRQLAAPPPASFDDPAGSQTDRAGGFARSPTRSHGAAAQSATACGESHIFHDPSATWDDHGILINQQSGDSSSKESQRAHTQTTMADSFHGHDDLERQHTPEVQLIKHVPTLPPEQVAGAGEKYHTTALDPMIAEWHRAINPGRAIADAELFALLDLQQRYGIDALRRWLFRTTNTGKTYVLPSYYEACAAADAFSTLGQSRSNQRQIAVDMSPEVLPTEEPVPRPRSQQPTRAVPPRPLDAEHAGLVTEIEGCAGRLIRRPDKLADVALDLLGRWRDIAGHPGLLARWEMGWLVSEVAKGHEPPNLDELNRWAEDKGLHWADPRLAPFSTVEQDKPQPAAEVALEQAPPEDCDNVISELLQANASASAGLWQDVLQGLRSQTDLPSFRAWLRPARLLTLTDCLAIIGVPDGANKGAIERKYTHPIRELLRERLGRTVDIQIVVAPAAPLYQPPPEWIDTTTWQQLDVGLRAALAGSSLGPDGGLDVRADAYELLCTCYAAPMRALLERAQARSP